VRDTQVVEAELIEISAIGDDLTKFERLVAWSATHPDELAFAWRYFSGRSDRLGEWARQHADKS